MRRSSPLQVAGPWISPSAATQIVSSTARARLRTLRPNRRRFRSPRHDPYHAQTLDQTMPLIMNLFFLDLLLSGQARADNLLGGQVLPSSKAELTCRLIDENFARSE